MKPTDLHEISAVELLEASRHAAPMLRVHTARDVLPGGLAAAMVPALVNWEASTFESGEDRYFLVNNVNIGANPIEGTTLLAALRIPLGGIETVEYVFVVSRVASRDTRAGHGMLRFVFAESRQPVVLSSEGQPVLSNAGLRDLVFSWEAWRPPGTSFDPVSGLDPSTYALTMRCFNGSVRCLSDAILGRPWVCYPLRLPDVPHAFDLLLYECLLLGDTVARQTIGSLLDSRIEQGFEMPAGYEDPEVEAWALIRDALQREDIPESPIDELLGGNTSYHLLERSCITMALTSLDAANVRICRVGGLEEPRRIRVAPRAVPGFFAALAGRKRTGALMQVPGAFHWLMHNQTVIPGKSHQLIDEVGLLERDERGIVHRRFDNREETPYGRPSDNLIF
jgi:hypothetical protein